MNYALADDGDGFDRLGDGAHKGLISRLFGRDHRNLAVAVGHDHHRIDELV